MHGRGGANIVFEFPGIERKHRIAEAIQRVEPAKPFFDALVCNLVVEFPDDVELSPGAIEIRTQLGLRFFAGARSQNALRKPLEPERQVLREQHRYSKPLLDLPEIRKR